MEHFDKGGDQNVQVFYAQCSGDRINTLFLFGFYFLWKRYSAD